MYVDVSYVSVLYVGVSYVGVSYVGAMVKEFTDLNASLSPQVSYVGKTPLASAYKISHTNIPSCPTISDLPLAKDRLMTVSSHVVLKWGALGTHTTFGVIGSHGTPISYIT